VKRLFEASLLLIISRVVSLSVPLRDSMRAFTELAK
jgi:hypothetical protein